MYNDSTSTAPRHEKARELLDQLYMLKQSDAANKISMPQDVVLQILPWKDKKIEHFIAIFVDNKNNIIQKKVISKGTVDQTPVYPREILRTALLKQASGLILAHNHPGGDPKPSIQDQELTSKVRKACDVFDIRLLDHVIIARDGHFSFNEHGII